MRKYDANGAVTRCDINGSSNDKYIAYNVANQPTKIVHGNSIDDTTPEASDEFAYGPDGDRYYRRTKWNDGVLYQEDVIYAGDLEIITDNIVDAIDKIYKTQIGENVMHARVEGTDPVTFQPTTATFFEYAYRDHLGSIELVTDGNGNVLDHMAFEPYGLRKNKDWRGNATSAEIGALLARSASHTPRVRGFTGHERLDRTGFIHMNGRMYDPLLSRFLSPDPIVQAPTYNQSWNRYSYVFGTPTSVIDPTGFISVDDGGGFEIDWGWGSG